MLGPMIVASLLLGGLVAWLGWPAPWAAWVICAGLGLLVLWGLWFFRDPVRRVPEGATAESVISPADGKVIKVDLAPLPVELAEAVRGLGHDPLVPLVRVSIFLNLFDVHVNRVVVGGRIVKLAYTPGAFVNASFDKASTHNERNAALMVDGAGRVLAFSQIAGLVARRIVCHLREGQSVAAGERFGLIRFGSRAEVWMPAGTRVDVQVGQRVTAGVSVLATMAQAASGVGVASSVGVASGVGAASVVGADGVR